MKFSRWFLSLVTVMCMGLAGRAWAVDPEVSGRIERNIDRLLQLAEGDADSPQNATDELSRAVDALNAEDAKTNLSADARQKLQARVDVLQTKLKAATQAADAKRFADRIERDVRAANENAKNDMRFTRTRLDEATTLLNSDEAAQKLDPATIERLQSSISSAEANVAGVIKKDALLRATNNLNLLEPKIASDPFKGADSNSAYKVSQELKMLTGRAAYQLSRIPEGDADRKAAEQRLAADQQKIDGYDAAWATANVEAAVVNRWKFTQQGFEGWDNESTAAGGRAFEKPKLPKTEQAARAIKQFLEEKETVDARQKQAQLPDAASAIAEADKTLADVQTKLDAAFNFWMDAAEKQPRPQGETRFDIGAASDMGRWVDDYLAGSKYQTADAARAKKLDQRWQDELAALKQQHEDALKKMTADANDAWPKIASAIPAKEGFHPADVASAKGKTYRFKAIRNRSGWDFDGRYDLVIWVDGQPVAGTYDAKIRKAFADAAHEIGDSVDDHIDWEIIAVIEGTGIVNRRFTTEVKDEHMNVLGKVEGTHPMDCVRMKVIAVHAGPVAVSAK
jgi:hypothetical protein